MFELSVSNAFLWILSGLIFGIVFLYIIPNLVKGVLNLFFSIKYSNYFVQKMIYEYTKEGKSFKEIANLVNQKTKGVRNGN